MSKEDEYKITDFESVHWCRFTFPQIVYIETVYGSSLCFVQNNLYTVRDEVLTMGQQGLIESLQPIKTVYEYLLSETVSPLYGIRPI